MLNTTHYTEDKSSHWDIAKRFFSFYADKYLKIYNFVVKYSVWGGGDNGISFKANPFYEIDASQVLQRVDFF